MIVQSYKSAKHFKINYRKLIQGLGKISSETFKISICNIWSHVVFSKDASLLPSPATRQL